MLKALIEINVAAEFLKRLNNVGHLWGCKMTKLGGKLNYLAPEHQMNLCGNLGAISACACSSLGRDMASTAELLCFLSTRAWMQQQTCR